MTCRYRFIGEHARQYTAARLCRVPATTAPWPSQTVKSPTWPALAQATRAATRVSKV